MRNRSKSYLWGMLQAVQAIQQSTEHKPLADYRASTIIRDAVERRFEIPGEALVCLGRHDAPTAERIAHRGRIVGFRNVLVHAYDRVDDEQVWNAIQKRLLLSGSSSKSCLQSPTPPTHDISMR